MLCWALNAQWQIESEYNIFVELLLVTVVWGICNTLINYAWIEDTHLLDMDIRLSLNQLRWYDFTFLCIRSLFCILITSIKPIYDTYYHENLQVIPPDLSSLDHFENVLHNPVGIDYFFKYLEENSSEVHLLALYIDLRLYESSARKKRQFEKTVQQETQEDRVGNSVVSSQRPTNLFNSMMSGSSNNSTCNPRKINNLQEELLEIAERIFYEYISLEAQYAIQLDNKTRCQIYEKFGCRQNQDSHLNTSDGNDPTNYDSTQINLIILSLHLDVELF